jgi:hypothetical protein
MNAVVTSHLLVCLYSTAGKEAKRTPGEHPLALAAQWTAGTNSNSARWDHYALGN